MLRRRPSKPGTGMQGHAYDGVQQLPGFHLRRCMAKATPLVASQLLGTLQCLVEDVRLLLVQNEELKAAACRPQARTGWSATALPYAPLRCAASR